MNGVLIILLALVLVAVLLKGKKSSKSKPASNKSTADWRIDYSPGMPKHPVMQGSGWYFDFPTNPASHVHYVPWHNPPALAVGKKLYVKFSVTGDGFVPQEYPTFPALVSLLIQRKGDNWSASGPYASYRWYSSQTVRLATGEYEMTVPLDVSAWGDVYNGQDAAAFSKALKDVDNIGLVFGSDGGRGHGVYSTMPARFTLIEMAVQ